MANTTIVLTFLKSTKGTHVYNNEGLGITGVYLPKELLPTTAPVTISLIVPAKTAPSSAATLAENEDQL